MRTPTSSPFHFFTRPPMKTVSTLLVSMPSTTAP